MITRQYLISINLPSDKQYQVDALDLLVEIAENAESLSQGGAEQYFLPNLREIIKNQNNDILDFNLVLNALMNENKAKQRALTKQRIIAIRELALTRVAIAWAVAVLDSSQDDDTARHCLCLAHQFFGMLVGMQFATRVAYPTMRMSAVGVQERHKDNRADRAEVFNWCDQHRGQYKTAVEAATAVLDARIVQAEFKTICNWMTEWKKARSKPTGI